jgi:uncharacterized membrane protein YraQ (UPF0718 family)
MSGVGSAVALMMTLPHVSLPSLAMTGQVLSIRVVAMTSVVVLVMGIVAGLLAVLFRF